MINIDIWKKMSNAKKASFALMLAKICQKGIAMISAPIFTRIMITEQYGSVTNFQSWESVILILATLNLSMGVFNNGMLDYSKDRDRFTTSCLILSNICTIIVFSVILAFKGLFSTKFDLSFDLLLLMLGYMFFYPAYSYWSSRQRYEFKYKLLTFLTILISVLQLLASIICVLLVSDNQQAVSRIYATQGVLIIVGVAMYILILCKSHFKWSLGYIKYAFKFNIYLVPHFLAMSVLSSGDRIMINSMVGKTATAIYGVSYSTAYMISIFWQAIEASWTPWLFENLKVGRMASIKKRGNQVITVFAGISVLCMLFAPELMKLLASKEYQEGVFIIPSVTGGVFFTSVYALYMRVEYYYKKTKATMISSVLAAVANVGLNLVFIKIFGYIAAGFTTLLCYALLYVFHYFYCKHKKITGIYDDKYIALLSLAVLIISILICLIYYVPVIRIIVICFMCLLCILKRKALLSQIKDILS